jgi:polar amino acid transport system substrate-binding protein
MYKEKKVFTTLIVIAIVGLGITLSGCVEEEAENKIIVGTSADFPPFEYVDNDGNYVGFDIEMVTMILEDMNYTVEIEDTAFEGLIGALKTDKIDVIAAAMSITEEREKEVDFSIPYYEADLSVLVLTKSNYQLNETNYITELANLTIGAQTGTTGAGWVTENLINNTNMSEDQFTQYTTYTLAVLDLENENIHAIIIDKPVAEAFAKDADKEIAYIIETDEEYGLAVKEGNTELLEKLNQGLTKLMGSQEWTDLVKKYFE